MKNEQIFSIEKFNSMYTKTDKVSENRYSTTKCKICLDKELTQYKTDNISIEEAVCNLLMSDIDKYYSDVNINSIQAIETYGEIQFITEFDGKDNGKLNKDIINYPDGVIRFTVDENNKIIRK